MGALCTPGTMVLTRLRCVPQPASAAFQRPVPNLGRVLHSFHPNRQDDEASTKGSLSFARPSFSSPVAPEGTRALRLEPWAPHSAVTRDARQGGDRPSSTSRGSRPHYRNLSAVIHSSH